MVTSEDARNLDDAEDAGPNWFRTPGWLQDVIVGVLIALAAGAPNPEGPSLALAAIPATAVSVLIVVLVLPWGRRFPLPVLGFTVAVAALAPLWTKVPGGAAFMASTIGAIVSRHDAASSMKAQMSVCALMFAGVTRYSTDWVRISPSRSQGNRGAKVESEPPSVLRASMIQ